MPLCAVAAAAFTAPGEYQKIKKGQRKPEAEGEKQSI